MNLVARHPRRRGFTLIEAAIVTAIIGIGIVSMVQLFAAGTMANADSAELTSAVYLANNIDEMLQGATYSTLKATYDNHTYEPPVDGTGAQLSGFTGWKQVVSVKYVDHNLLTFVVPDTQVEPTSRVTVTVYHNNSPIYTASWNVVQPQ
jgi:prepilin-type N-terminal cleavage/methylation domain-containing protein